MTTPHPQEFSDDVVRVARTREDSVSIAQIKKDFGARKMTLRKWIRQAFVDDGKCPNTSPEASTEPRHSRWRIQLREQDNETLPGAAA